jgi:hypothetical protein
MMPALRIVIVLALSISVVPLLAASGNAEFEWSILKNIPLAETPRDIALTLDGSTV